MTFAGYDAAFAAAALLAVTVAVLAALNVLNRSAVFAGLQRAWLTGAAGLAFGAGVWSGELLGVLARYAGFAPNLAFLPMLGALVLDVTVGCAAAAALSRRDVRRREGLVLIAFLLAGGTVAARVLLLAALPGVLPGALGVPSVAAAMALAVAGAGLALVFTLRVDQLSPERQAVHRPLVALVVATSLALSHAATAPGPLGVATAVSGGAGRIDAVGIGLMVAMALLAVMMAVQVAATVHTAAETRAHQALEALRAGMARLDHEAREHSKAREALAAANTALRTHVASERRMLADAQALGELAQALSLCLSDAEVACALGAHAPKLLPGSAALLLRLAPDLRGYVAFGRWGQPRGLDRFAREACLAVRDGQPRRLSQHGGALPCAHVAPVVHAGGAVLCAPLTAVGEELGLLVVELPGPGADAATRHQSGVAAGIADRLAFALANVRLRAQAVRDPLTGLYNRRLLEQTLTREIARAGRDGKSLAVMLVDIDHFKVYNDTFGHAAGDRAIRAVADTLLAQLRGSDLVCRYGGEEFLALLTDVRLHEAMSRAREVCVSVRGLLAADARLCRRLTVSAGVAGFPDHGTEPDELIRAADVALYAAKAGGRDGVMLAVPAGYSPLQSEEA